MKPTVSIQGKISAKSSVALPSVTLVLPFEPKMTRKDELEYLLKVSKQKAEQQLLSEYTADVAMPVIERLYSVTNKINFNSYRKSIVIHVSPTEEKVMYLDIDVRDKIMIDESFDIRKVVALKKDKRKFLILQITPFHSNFYLFDGRITRLRSNSLSHTRHIKKYRDLIQTNPQLEIFYRYTDEALQEIIDQNPYPVFVMGNDSSIDAFKEVTSHAFYISGFIKTGLAPVDERKIRNLLKVNIGNWELIHQQSLLVRAEAAFTRNKLAYGIDEVSRQAKLRNGKLLLVEAKAKPLEDAASAQIIEMVVNQGGDVAFVDDGLLKHFGHIAMILR